MARAPLARGKLAHRSHLAPDKGKHSVCEVTPTYRETHALKGSNMEFGGEGAVLPWRGETTI